MRRLAAASRACSGSGQTVAVSTLSSMRTATATTSANARCRSAPRPERIAHEAGQVDAAEAAAAVVGDRDLAAGVGRLDPLAVVQVVLGVDPVEEQHPGSASS